MERGRWRIRRGTPIETNKWSRVVAALLHVESTSGGCTSPEEINTNRLMEEIEARIKLPSDAESIDKYVRFYTFDGHGKVLGRFVLPRGEESNPNAVCQEVRPDGGTTDLPCPPQAAWPGQGRAGQRIWVQSSREFPMMLDGGCARINVQYDIASQKVERASCNERG